MGFFDNAENLLNKGVATAGRSTKSFTLKAQIADLNRSRTALMAQLGESLFDATRIVEEYRAPWETLYASVEDIDEQIASLQTELETLERQANAASVVSASSVVCPSCGKVLTQGDLFCPGCGINMEEARTFMNRCATCGHLLNEDDAFCMGCGAPVQALEDVVEGAPPEDVDLVDNLTCPACGYVLAEGDVFCMGCGLHVVDREEPSPELEPLVDSETSEIAIEDTQPEPSSNAVPMVEPILAPIPVPDGKKICPHCGYFADVSAAFCRSCGRPLY